MIPYEFWWTKILGCADLQHHSGAPRTCNPVLSSEMAANARARWEKEKADHMDHAKGVLQHYANQLCPCAAKVSQPTDDTSSALETQVCTFSTRVNTILTLPCFFVMKCWVSRELHHGGEGI